MLRITLFVAISALHLSACGGSDPCGPNTRKEGDLCVADAPISCAAGSHLDGARCISDLDDTTVCAMGTHFENKQGVPDSRLGCGTGTHIMGDLCISDVVGDTGPTIWKTNVMVKSDYCAEPSMGVDSAGVGFIACISTFSAFRTKSTDQGANCTD